MRSARSFQIRGISPARDYRAQPFSRDQEDALLAHSQRAFVLLVSTPTAKQTRSRRKKTYCPGPQFPSRIAIIARRRGTRPDRKRSSAGVRVDLSLVWREIANAAATARARTLGCFARTERRSTLGSPGQLPRWSDRKLCAPSKDRGR